MSRSTYGGSIADVVQTQGPGGTLKFAATILSVWSAKIGGTHHTDLLLDDTAVNAIPVATDGQIPAFDAPDGVNDGVWIDAPGATARVLLLPRGGGGGGGSVDPGEITITTEDIGGLDELLGGYQPRDDNAVTGSQAGIEIVIDDGTTDPDALPPGHLLAPEASRLLVRPVSAPVTRKAVTIETDGSQGSVDVSSLGGAGGGGAAPTPVGAFAFPRAVTTAASDIFPGGGIATFYPIDLAAGTYDALAVQCIGARSGGTIDGKIALYASTSDGLPDTVSAPVMTGSILTTTVTGIKLMTQGSPVVLAAGRYWGCSYMTESSTPTVKPTFTCILTRGLILPQNVFGPAGDPAAVSSLRRTGLAASTLPTTASTLGNLALGTDNKHPVIGVRRSA